MYGTRRRRRILYNDDADQQYVRTGNGTKTKYVQQQPDYRYGAWDIQAACSRHAFQSAGD